MEALRLANPADRPLTLDERATIRERVVNALRTLPTHWPHHVYLTGQELQNLPHVFPQGVRVSRCNVDGFLALAEWRERW